MFTTAPLFGKFHSPLKAAGLTLRRRPLHHLESLCAQRIDPRLLQPNETGDNSRQRIYTPRLTFLAFLDQTLDPASSCRSAVDQILAYYHALPHHPQIDPDTSAYYRLLARHGWRKVTPDTRHPKSKPEVQEEWEKNSRKCWKPC
jgi:hypothetical protein